MMPELPSPRRAAPSPWALLAVALLTAGVAGPRAASRPAADDDEPTAAMRTFFAAMALGDADALAAVAIHRDGMDILTANAKPMSAAGKAHMRDQLVTMPLTRLKAGDTFTVVLNGQRRTGTVDVTQANDGVAAISLSPGTPPMTVVRVDGKWLVDPRPLILARQAAQRARDRQRAATTQP